MSNTIDLDEARRIGNEDKANDIERALWKDFLNETDLNGFFSHLTTIESSSNQINSAFHEYCEEQQAHDPTVGIYRRYG